MIAIKYINDQFIKVKAVAVACAVIFVVLMLPASASAQLFGGQIKANQPGGGIPNTITLGQARTYYVVSVYDQDYLPYTLPTAAASTATQAADGVSEAVTVNRQGFITTTGVTVNIPVIATASGTLPAFSTTVTIPASLTQDGVSRVLMLSWPETAYTTATVAITATIAAVGGQLNAKKLDINAGLGPDYEGILLGAFSYPYNSKGNTTSLQVRDIPGIPDRMFGQFDNGNTTAYEHNFLYAPVVAEDGTTWLNNNLGADYTNTNGGNFDFTQQATSATDYLAYGSLFQWGRKPDGHELITWTSGSAGTPVYGTTTSTLSDNPAHAQFITTASDWRVTQNDALWASEASANNPCPKSFRIPTLTEQTALFTAAGIANSTNAANSILKFTAPGYRDNSNGSFPSPGLGIIWSSSISGTAASNRAFNGSTTYTYNNVRSLAASLRCIKDAGVAIPAGLTLGQNQKYFVISAYDTDYLPYSVPTVAASTASQTADGSTDSPTVNVQGSIATTGVTVTIPVTATSAGTLPAYTITTTIPANLTQDGISRDLTLSWPATAYTTATKYITATITAVGGTLNAKKLDINAGLGNDYMGVLLGAFSYPYNNVGSLTTFQVRDIPGIPDKMFGLADNSGTKEHNMLYAPVTAEDGNIWLNNNLGADYCTVSNTSFNPGSQATAYNDYHAYGSLFQWGRKPDGHELIKWTNGTTGASVYPVYTSTQNDNPADTKFITVNGDWRITPNDVLWATEASANNPCPSGFRVPTSTELTTLVSAAGITNLATAQASVLKFAANGDHKYDGTLNLSSTIINLYSSTAGHLRVINTSTADATQIRAYGYAIRCIKDNGTVTIPAGITLGQNQKYLVASVYDTDYLPYVTPTTAATVVTQAADGVAEATVVNVQGSITTSGITISIPVTVATTGTLPPYSTRTTIPAAMTQDGISRELTLWWPEQTCTAGTTKAITAYIQAVGGTFNAKKLDLNAGLGNDNLGVLLGSLVYPYNSTGNTSIFQVRDIPGIPDRMFGQADNSATQEHNMLYMPVTAEDGNVWLNNNLGADYANLAKVSSFSPATQATAYNDYHAYGSFFQWGRKPDGHELMNWTSSTAGTGATTTATLSDTPAHALFITTSSDWRSTQNDALWATEASANNPCPAGFRVPTQTELNTWLSAAGIANTANSANSRLHLTTAGNRVYNTGNFDNINSQDLVWTSTQYGTNSYYIGIGSSAYTGNFPRGEGFSVRCIQNTTVTIPSTITLGQNGRYFIASVYDNNYLPYTAPTVAATTDTNVNPDGTTETLANAQGILTTTGVTVKIPVTATGSGTLPPYSTTTTIAADKTQDGISRQLILEWAEQAYTTGTKYITATIRAVGGTLNAKKLDINAGIGNDQLGVLMGSFAYPYNNAGKTTAYQLRDIAGIPDKMFGLADNSGTKEHNMLYLPAQAEDGNIWLANNLGSDYSTIGKTSFNPNMQATSATDYLAYGSLFQWGRKPDGHELINWTSGTAGTAVYGTTTSTLNDNPAHTQFITSASDWRSTQNDALWATEASTNNPCPAGFRVPTATEYTTLVSAAGITYSTNAASSMLKFSVAGDRQWTTGVFSGVGSTTGYLCSTVYGANEQNMHFDAGSAVIVNTSPRAQGILVRCIKDKGTASIPSTITLGQNAKYIMASVYDQDYLPYTTPTAAASTSTVAADGANESVTVDVQGSITTTGVTITIPVTATANGTLPPYSTTTTIPASATQDGISRQLVLEWGEQTYTTATPFITATIRAVGGSLNAPKLDVNGGIGSDYLGLLMGSFTYPYNNAGKTSTFQLRDIAGIPDKKYGLADNASDATTHKMLYVPVQAEDGKVWLNNNLGADYANVNKADLNPGMQAVAATDYRAYGSLFEWGRKPDGHELISWTASTAAPKYGSIAALNDNPTHALYITTSGAPYEWRVTQNDGLWSAEFSANNPCPSGFRLPSLTEQTNLFTAAGITNAAKAVSSILRFTVPGGRYVDGSFQWAYTGSYWSNSVGAGQTNYANYRAIDGSSSSVLANVRSFGFSVRCIQDYGITIPSSITLGQNQRYMVKSTYDTDFLPYTAPTAAASTSTVTADGTTDSPTVDIQGSISTTGVTVTIPATATMAGTLPAYSSTITIPASITQDGISRQLTLSWPETAYTAATTSITATLKAVGGTLNAKKLDLNAGIGNDNLGVLMGAFSFPYNNAGNTTTFQVRDIAAFYNSCAQIKTLFPASADGVYWVSPDSNASTYAPTRVYCDMTTDGGGWTLIGQYNHPAAAYMPHNRTDFPNLGSNTIGDESAGTGTFGTWGLAPAGLRAVYSFTTIRAEGWNTTNNTGVHVKIPNSPNYVKLGNVKYDFTGMTDLGKPAYWPATVACWSLAGKSPENHTLIFSDAYGAQHVFLHTVDGVCSGAYTILRVSNYLNYNGSGCSNALFPENGIIRLWVK